MAIAIQQERPSDYIVCQLLGEGPLGPRFLAKHKVLEKMFYLQKLSIDLSTGLQKQFEKELLKLSECQQPHLLRQDRIIELNGEKFLIGEVDIPGELVGFDKYIPSNGLTEKLAFQLCLQIAETIDSQQHSVMLAPHSIFIDNSKEQPHLYLADWALEKLLGKQELDKQRLLFAKKSNDFAEVWKELIFMKSQQETFATLAYYVLMGRLPSFAFTLRPGLTMNWQLLFQRCFAGEQIVTMQQLMNEISAPSQTMQLGQLADILAAKIPARGGNLQPVLKPGELKRPEYEADPAAAFIIDQAVVKYTPKGQEKTSQLEPLLSSMAIIEGGEFFRGSVTGGRDEMPKHAIHLSSFAIDIHPVTNEQFVRFLEVLGGEKDADNRDIIRLRESRIKRAAGKLMIESGYGKHPVVGVTWYGAVAYAKWIGKRLPTEAEWEIAARGGNAAAEFPTGEDIERSQANFFSSDTTAVMSYPPNGYGLYDMGGNVYEWCQDWYAYNAYDLSSQEPDDPAGPAQGVYRVLRGGCWKSLKQDLRCAHRNRNNPGVVNKTYGFRCAADAR